MSFIEPLPPHPFTLFKQWLDEALQLDVAEPWAMVLSTSLGGEAFSRVVLLKKIVDFRLFFYTNYQSSKALQLASNPRAALNFYWDELGRQVCLRGEVQKASREDSENYWKSRSRASQLSQHLSKQSQSLPNGLDLKKLHSEVRKELGEIPCPEHWGGYEFWPDVVEFWLRGEERLHHRWIYKQVSKEGAKDTPMGSEMGEWEVKALYP